MVRIIADDKIPFLEGVLEPYAEISYIQGNKITTDQLKSADALLIRTRTKCTMDLLKGTSVKFIGTATIGFDHIDTRYCASQKIKWLNAPGCNSSSVEQYISAALLKIALEFRFSLKDKTLGIVGVGNVGSKVERLARILGMKVILCDPPRARIEGNGKFTPFSKLLSESDIVTLHVPLNIVGEDKTYHLMNEKSFKKMKKGAWIINSCRGEVIETNSIKDALNSGRLAGAVLDVWENEPDLDLELMDKTFLATPHIAGYSSDGKANGTSMIVSALSEFFDLPLKKWYPENVPSPNKPLITIDGADKNAEEIIFEVVNHTYNINEDDLRLRFSPSDFEKFRGDYGLRREFPAYTVKLKNVDDSILNQINSMGFRI